MKIRLLELCAGYGSQALALKNLGIEVYSEIAEFDKYASQAYMQLHGETKNYGDIYTIDETKLPYFDMITYSTPCFTEDSLVLTEKRGFQKIIDIQIGEKVITHDGNYKTVENVINNGKKKTVKAPKIKDISNAIRCSGRQTLDKKHTWDIVAEPLCAASRGRNPDNPSDRTTGSPTEQRLEINTHGCTNTLTSVQKDNYVVEPQVLTPKRTEYGKQIRKDYESGLISESRHNMTSMEPRKDGISNTLTTVQKDNFVLENYRIRKLTPRECWRLMGVKDEQFDRLHGISNSQLYKLAGNSIVVDVLEAIFKNLLMPETTDTKGQLSLF